MNDFSAAVVAAYDRVPQWRRDQLDAHIRDAIPLLERMCDLVRRLDAETPPPPPPGAAGTDEEERL